MVFSSYITVSSTDVAKHNGNMSPEFWIKHNRKKCKVCKND